MPEYGLKTETALKILKETIRNQLVFCTQLKKGWLWLPQKLFTADSTLHFSWIGCGGIFLVLVAILANLFAFHMDSYATLLAEFVILLLLFVGILLFCVREVILKENEIERAITQLLSKINEKVIWSEDQYPNLTLPDSRSFTLVWTYRDGRVVNLPWNLVVEGDVIILGSGGVALTRCREVRRDSTVPSNPLVVLEAGDTFNPTLLNIKESDPFPRQCFEVMQTPVETVISSYFYENAHKKVSICNVDAKIIRQFIEQRLLFAVVLFVLLVNIIRWKLIPEASGFNLEMIFLIPCHSIFPLLPLTFPVLWKFASFYGAARLRVLLNIYAKFYTKASDSEEIVLEHVDRLAVWKSFWMILCGDPQGLPRRIDLMHTLGSITTFSCVDKEGILCYPNPIPEKLFFFENTPTRQPSQTIESSGNPPELLGCISSHIDGSSDEVKILTLSPDPQSCNGLCFDESEWQKSILSLKPIGLNMLLNSPCLYPLKSIKENDFINQLLLASNNSLTSGLNGCLCHLAREIGFQDTALKNFQNKQKIFTYSPIDSTEGIIPSSFYLSIVREKRLPHMISSVVNQTNNNVTQMFSSGSADIVLEACTDIWNGFDIKPLSDVKKEKALNFFQRMDITGKCLAYSYRPVFEDVAVNDHTFVQFCNKCWDSVELEDSEKKSETESQNSQEDLSCEDLLKNVPNNSGSVCQLDKQIFLGMVTLTHLLKEDVLTLVEQLNVAGVRFVHFSYDNELLSRVFCQRLGLETGWNCHISLSDDNDYVEYSSSAISDSCPFLYQDDVDCLNRSFRRREIDSSIGSFRRRERDSSASILAKVDSQEEDESPKNVYSDFDELYFMTNRSKLPKGIQRMRSHLEEVDDVPLLVPLFTDCTAQAVCEMINIMQDYDDIVCCIGSSLNSRNHTIFSSTDVSISVNPIFRKVCPTKQHKLNDCYDLKNSEDIWSVNKIKGPLELSSMLNSISCSLRLSREENFPMSALLCESRRLLFGLRSCFLFLVYCHLFLTTLQVLSTCFLLPPPLSGLQMLWLICIIIPLLSISLIGAPNNGKLMKIITGKRKKHNYKDFASTYVKQFFVTFGLNALLITTVLFPWLLTMFCKKSNAKTRCTWILGSRNASLSMGGYYNELKDGYHAAQDIVLCYITISFTFMSSSFVHRSDFLWKKSPFKNKPWCVCVLTSLLLQTILTLIFDYSHDIAAISPFFYSVCFVVILLLILLSEAYKGCLKRKSVRLQKRERLKFDTKLGMNSPI